VRDKRPEVECRKFHIKEKSTLPFFRPYGRMSAEEKQRLLAA